MSIGGRFKAFSCCCRKTIGHIQEIIASIILLPLREKKKRQKTVLTVFIDRKNVGLDDLDGLDAPKMHFLTCA
jgi:hypothetical protein